MDARALFKQPLSMKKTPENPARGEALKQARLAKGLRLREVADAMDPPVSTQAVSNWEAGQSITMPNLIGVCLFLEIDPIAANEGRLVPKENPGLADPDATTPQRVPFPQTGPRDIEVRGVTVGGDDADFYFNGQVVNMAARPNGIRNARDVFALVVVGESVSPRYFPGEIVYCQKVPAVPGDYVVIEMYPERDESAGKSFIKRLVQRKGATLICQQHNPDKTLEFDMGLVKDVFRIIPPNELLG